MGFFILPVSHEWVLHLKKVIKQKEVTEVICVLQAENVTIWFADSYSVRLFCLFIDMYFGY